ncbi:MAG: phosphonate C-P lyase system protein PhnL [Kiloniellales bacterium]
MDTILKVRDLDKSFTLHLQGGVHLPVLSSASFEAAAGDCLVLGGPSGSGKSSILKMIYGTYPVERGSIQVRHGETWVEVVGAESHVVRALRRDTIGYVSQFLRVIPRVPCLEIVAEPLLVRGRSRAQALERAAELLTRLNLPKRLWDLPPTTFSGGEQQRVNIARGFAEPVPLLLLDEPTASLDADNREAVLSLIEEARDGGAAILAIFHDVEQGARLAGRIVDVRDFSRPASRATQDVMEPLQN